MGGFDRISPYETLAWEVMLVLKGLTFVLDNMYMTSVPCLYGDQVSLSILNLEMDYP